LLIHTAKNHLIQFVFTLDSQLFQAAKTKQSPTKLSPEVLVFGYINIYRILLSINIDSGWVYH